MPMLVGRRFAIHRRGRRFDAARERRRQPLFGGGAGLAGAAAGRAVVAGVDEAVAVKVLAGIADAVAVAVELVGVVVVGAVVVGPHPAVQLVLAVATGIGVGGRGAVAQAHELDVDAGHGDVRGRHGDGVVVLARVVGDLGVLQLLGAGLDLDLLRQQDGVRAEGPIGNQVPLCREVELVLTACPTQSDVALGLADLVRVSGQPHADAEGVVGRRRNLGRALDAQSQGGRALEGHGAAGTWGALDGQQALLATAAVRHRLGSAHLHVQPARGNHLHVVGGVGELPVRGVLDGAFEGRNDAAGESGQHVEVGAPGAAELLQALDLGRLFLGLRGPAVVRGGRGGTGRRPRGDRDRLDQGRRLGDQDPQLADVLRGCVRGRHALAAVGRHDGGESDVAGDPRPVP